MGDGIASRRCLSDPLIQFGELALVQLSPPGVGLCTSPGVAIAEFAARATHGHVYGIDHSRTMVRHATRRNVAVRAGRVHDRIVLCFATD
ncbi:hypothetical protein ACFWUP_03510 [Nocardia sp. NPDC058658]|uniref:hypothetical protein n=1 Tax=Nocardia sp. NPDC058658 TaxID=3346580 RepID=UPI0036552705